MAKKKRANLEKPFYTTDEGGNAYLKGRVWLKTSIASELTMRCLDCRRLNLVLRRQLSRIARPRCTHCGGPLEEIEASRKRRLGDPSKKQEEVVVPTTSCRACNLKFSDPWALGLHLTNKVTCMSYYKDEGLIIVTGECNIIFDTIFATREELKRSCILRGYTTEGRLRQIKEFPSTRSCKEFLVPVFGSHFKLHIARV